MDSLDDDLLLSLSDCRCLCRVLAAELEGLKLDVVILQKRIDSHVDETTEIMLRDDDLRRDDKMNRLKREIVQEKEKSKRLEADLLLIMKERNNEFVELKNTISSLKTKVIKHKEENNSLSPCTFALQKTMQK